MFCYLCVGCCFVSVFFLGCSIVLESMAIFCVGGLCWVICGGSAVRIV